MKTMLCVCIVWMGLLAAPVCAQPENTPFDEGGTTVRLLEGDNPDPSIIRCGSNYYLLHSSFLYSPGLVVYRSDNLVDWTPCSVALPTFTGDIWAPDLVEHKGRYYIYFPTRTDGVKSNMVTWADSPEGPWSEPVTIQVKGIDPEHVVDENGKRHLLLSSGDLYPLSDDGLRVTGEPVKIYKGWPVPEEWDIEGVSMEGLNVKKVGEYYYLFAAEGGTAGPPTGHMVVQARSKSVTGPWENAPFNPLLRTVDRNEKWWSKGHGSLVDTPDGRLFMIFHGYENGFQTLGRQTLLRELEQGADGWLHLKPGPLSLPAPKRPKEMRTADFVWQTCREHDINDRFRITPDKITIKGKGKTPKEASPLLARTSAHCYEIEACLQLKGEHASAGLMAYYNEDYHFGFGFDRKQLLRYRRGQLNRTVSKVPEANEEGKLWLKLRNDHHVLSAWYSADGKRWHKYPWGFEIAGVHHNTVYGFLFVRPGIYAGGEGEVEVTDFVLRNLDE